MRKFLLLLAMFTGFSILAFSQTRTVTGTVMDEATAPVPFATISVKGTTTGLSADAEGKFSINATEGAVLVVSATGYATTEITVHNGIANVVLKKGEGELIEEVVVTALGIQRQAKSLGYATAKVDSKELTQAKSVNLQNGLTGKVSGLNIATTNSGVYGDTRITLRGIRSLTGNNQPMLIVDGIPVPLGFLSSINPNDIEKVDILKSGSATQLYGPDGVNGAIVIVSKKGAKGKPVITVSHTTQIEIISYMPEFQGKYGSGYAPDANGYGTYEPIEQQSWGPEFNGEMVQIGQDGPNGEKMMVPYSYVKNARRNFYDRGLTTQTDVSLATGDFYLSGQNVSIKGTMPGDVLDRRTFSMSADKEFGKFKVGFSLRYTNAQHDITNNNQVVYYGVTSSPGQIDISKFSDWRNDYFSSPDGYYTPYLDNNGKTPYFAKDNWREYGKTDDVFGNIKLDYKFTDWLNFTYRVGLTYTNLDAKSTRGAFNYSSYHETLKDHGTINITAATTNSSNLSRRITSEAFATINKRFNDFGVNAILGQSYRESNARFLSIGSDNLGTAQSFTVQLRKGEPAVNVDNSKTRLERYFGEVNLDYGNWVFLKLNGSYDIDSRLYKPGANYKKSDIAYFYPGVSTSIVLSELLPSLKSGALNYFKVRGSVSKTGNVNLSAYNFENVFDKAIFFPYGDILGFQASSLTFADGYEPEFVVNKEVGLELGFLKNRINFEATYYHQDNTNQVIDVAQSITTGYTSARQNAASFINKGLELDLRLTPLIKLGDFNVDFKVNYSKQKNEVISLVGGVDELGIGNANYAIVGQPAFVFKVSDYNRDDQGRVIVNKETGMPTQNPNLSVFGQTQPTDILGMNLNLSWKALSLSAVADYRTGNMILADQLGTFLDDNGISARSAQFGRRPFIFPNSVINNGTDENPVYTTNTNVYTTNYGRLFWNSDLNTNVTSNYLADGSFWKLREVALNYDLPVTSFGLGISNVLKSATFTLSGRNLLMWVPKSNQWTDPEFQGGNGNAAYTGNATGRSTAYNQPPSRIFGASLLLRF